MSNEQLYIAAVLHSWKQVLGRYSDGIAPLTDEQFQKRVAPGKNRLYYLLGHLTAVHDRLFPLLGIGDRLRPDLDEAFITNPDGTLPDPLPAAELKALWTEINNKLTAALERFTPQQWLEKHTAVSNEDFAKDPTRNRLAVVLSRTNHLSYHSGQAMLTK